MDLRREVCGVTSYLPRVNSNNLLPVEEQHILFNRMIPVRKLEHTQESSLREEQIISSYVGVGIIMEKAQRKVR